MDEVYLAILGGDDRLRARVAETLKPIRECSKRLLEDVGEVPTPRFEAGYALIGRACRRFETFANAFERSLSADDPSAALQELDTANSEGTDLIVRAGQLIEARLTANRPLPRVGGDSEQSRVEPRFSRVGSELARKRVEVRCWSEREWPRVVGEWGAYIGTNDIGAFAQPDTDRASLAPETCRALVGFAYERERPASGDALDEVAYAVGVLGNPEGRPAARSGRGLYEQAGDAVLVRALSLGARGLQVRGVRQRQGIGRDPGTSPSRLFETSIDWLGRTPRR